MSNPYGGYPIGVPVPASNPPLPAPQLGDLVYEIPVSPKPSPPQSRGQSRARRGTTEERPYVSYGSSDYRDKQYYQDHLSVRGGGAVARSNSVGGHRFAGRMEVSTSKPGRPRSYYGSGDEEYYRGRTGKYYYGEGYAESNYSSSSRGSREHSRGAPHYRRQRSPSCHSCDGHDYQHPQSPGLPYPNPGYPTHWPALAGAPPPAPPAAPAAPGAMTLFNPKVVNPQADINPELTKKIEDLQKQLEISKLESEKIRKAKEAEEEAARRKAEIQKEVQELLQKRTAAEQAAKLAAEAERRKIEEEARKLVEAEKAAKAAKDAADAKRKEEARIEAMKILEEEKKKEEKKKEEELRARTLQLDLSKPTYTKFSKTHLCKEALDERKIIYTEQDDSFLVHRWVDREEQQLLWQRTKEIRAYQLEYQRKFKDAADKAPIVQTPDGPVKIVRVDNHPPVTVPVVLVTKKANSEPEPVKFRHIFGLK